MRSIEPIRHSEDARGRLRWTGSFAVVLTLHLVAWLLAEQWPAPVETVTAPLSSAIMVDLAPAPTTPPATSPVQPSPRIQPSKPHHAIRAPSPLPPLPSSTDAAALTVDPQREPPQTADMTSAVEASTPPATPAQPEPNAVPAPSTAAQPSMSAPDWQSLVLGQLERFKHYPTDAQERRQQGVVYLRFTMDRSGRVLSFSIERSSGHELLDQEAMALLQRAQPLPKPPPSVSGDPLELVVPVEFFLSRR
jgi:protein TonB